MAFGRTSNVESQPGKAPLLGSFPLDHDGNASQ
jgi:cytochrome c oxidase assembly protein subunit 19